MHVFISNVDERRFFSDCYAISIIKNTDHNCACGLNILVMKINTDLGKKKFVQYFSHKKPLLFIRVLLLISRSRTRMRFARVDARARTNQTSLVYGTPYFLSKIVILKKKKIVSIQMQYNRRATFFAAEVFRIIYL